MMRSDHIAKQFQQAAGQAEEDLRDFSYLLDFFCEGVESAVRDLEEDLMAQIALLDSREMEDIWLDLADARNIEMVARMKAAYLIGYARGADLLGAMRPEDEEKDSAG